ncbi:hypothetical protein ACWGSU_22005 [Streptomyces koyangensis]
MTSDLPMPQPEDPVVYSGMMIAREWGMSIGGADGLKVALKALEPQLAREHAVHELVAQQAERRAEREAEQERHAAELAERRALAEAQQRLMFVRLIVGAVLALAMLGAGIFVVRDAWWLAALLCGPSLIALGKLFVLGRSDSDDMRYVAGGARGATDAAAQAQPPVPPAM